MRRTRWITSAIVLIGAATLVARVPEPRDESPRDRELRDLVTFTALVPADFAADALIRLSSSVTSPAWRRELLDEAFMRAYAAQEPYRRAATTGIPRDTRQFANQLAYATSLTRVSLQVRAAQLMAIIDAPHARELFEWINLDLAPGGCEDPLTPAVDEYYTALAMLARTTFGSNRTEALRFLELNLWRARLPSEMPAVVRAIQRFQPTRDEAAHLETVVRWILVGGRSDPRGFSNADLDIVSRVGDLEIANHALGLTGFVMMDGLRQYLLTQLQGPRCSDSVTESMTPASFNAVLRRLDADWVVPFLPAIIAPSKLLPAAHIDFYWQTAESRRLYDETFSLRGPGKTPYPESVRQTLDWRNRAERLLIELNLWSGRREAAERDYFYQKAMLFEGLLDLMPQSEVRARTLRSFIEFLRESDADRDRRALWFAILNRLLDAARGTERRTILATFEDSGNPVLALYGRLDRLAASRRSD